MSASIKWTLDDAQFDARSALEILDDVLRAIRETGRSYQDRILYQSISEAREKQARVCQIIEWLNPNGVLNHAAVRNARANSPDQV